MSDTQPPGVSRVLVERVFEVGVPPARAWEVVADTARVNRLFFALSPMEVIERDDEKTRLRGGFGLFGGEFEERPWEFEAPRRYRSERVFLRGPMKRLMVVCELENLGGRTRVHYVSELDLAPLAAAVGGWLFKRRIQRGLDAVERLLSGEPSAPVAWPPAYPHGDVVRARAQPFVDASLALEASDAERLSLLVEHLATADDADVARMRPYELAEGWGEHRDAVLACCLRATKAGLLNLSWELLCPSCENAAGQGASKLRDLSRTAHCEACDIDFSASFESNVEATFRPSASIRTTSPGLFCYGSPSRTPTWIAQTLVPPGEARELSLAVGPGRYRLQAAGVPGRCLLEAADDGKDLVEVRIARDGERLALPEAAPRLAARRATLVVRNDDERPRRVQLAHRAFASKAATAVDVTGLGLFRDLFADDVLSPEQHVEVGRAAILFTDLVGSTDLYERLGDAQAYALVREHFRLLEDVVEQRGGRVVKTIGDAVMAAFDRAADAIGAAADAIAAVDDMRDKEGGSVGLGLKVGIHEGPCLAVTANRAGDYFGRTVNVAARVQGLAEAREIVVSETAASSPGAAEQLSRLEQQGARLARDRCSVKGVSKAVEVVRVRLDAARAVAPEDDDATAHAPISSTSQPA